MSTRDPEALLAGLDPDQRRVAEQVSGPLAVLAGAGTGKTRAITHRIAHAVAVGAVDAQSVLALTFTTRAAGEMRLRLRDLGVEGAQARTFHSAALRQLQFFWPAVVGGQLPPLIEHKASLVAATVARLGLRSDRATVRDVSAEIEWSKVMMCDPEAYPDLVRRLGRETPSGVSATLMVDVLRGYERAKEERGVIDFEDVLALMCGMMEEREDVARRVRSQYRSFVVDEYQDVSVLQQHLLDLWLGGRHDICVVGDVAQTIYTFAGATPAHLTGFAQRHPGARVIELNRDYRSTPQVVSVANAVIGAAPGRAALPGAVHLRSQRPSGAEVRFSEHEDDAAEAWAVAERARVLVDAGVAPQSIAVLFRTNAQSRLLEEAMADAQVPCTVNGGERFFEREEVRRALHLLRRVAVGVLPEGEESALVPMVEGALTTIGWSEEAPSAQGAVRERWDSLNALVELARETPQAPPAEFLADLEERAGNQVAPTVASVVLSTLHAAKGLEWDHVFLIGAAEGLLPISLASTPAAREEERRLLYVGVTRARDSLEISWARSRGGRGRGKRRRSRLLDGIWPSEPDAPRMSASRRARARHGAEAAREFEENETPEVLARWEALKEWRRSVADEAGVPAYVVFTDAILRDIARARPRTLRQLRTVPGVGDVRLERHGAQVLRILRDLEPR